MVDIAGLVTSLSSGDFQFKVGDDNSPATWPALTATPTITVRPGQGVGGTNRVEITFDDYAVKKEWLQVTVLANDHTGLAANDVFYFGNAVGEAGDNPANARVNAVDELAARAQATNSASITNLYDYNRDEVVNIADQVVARTNVTCALNDLRLIAVPSGAGAAHFAFLPPAVSTGPVVTPPSSAPVVEPVIAPVGAPTVPSVLSVPTSPVVATGPVTTVLGTVAVPPVTAPVPVSKSVTHAVKPTAWAVKKVSRGL